MAAHPISGSLSVDGALDRRGRGCTVRVWARSALDRIPDTIEGSVPGVVPGLAAIAVDPQDARDLAALLEMEGVAARAAPYGPGPCDARLDRTHRFQILHLTGSRHAANAQHPTPIGTNPTCDRSVAN